MPVELILEAELAADAQMEFGPEAAYHSPDDQHPESVDVVYQAMDRQLMALVDWAKHIPHFTDLLLEDQVTLLRVGGSDTELCLYSVLHSPLLASF